MHARTEENVAMVDEPVRSPEDRPQIHRLSRLTAQPAVVWITFFTAIAY